MKYNIYKKMIQPIVTGVLMIGAFTAAQAQTTIVVDWALDEEPTNNTHTCSYTQGGLFRPDTTGSGAGKCTFRRALREAGARPFADRPITIQFTGLDGADKNADDSQLVGDQWVLPVSGASNASFFGIKPQSITDVRGQINIIGLPVDVQGDNEMPKIMIQSTQTMEVEMNEVLIQSMGFFGGMSVHAKEADFTFQNNTWGLAPDGSAVAFSFLTPGPNVNTENNLAGNHGVNGLPKADGLLVQNNIISGASTWAVEVNSATENVQILDNWIGTDINGTVPSVPENLECRTFTGINPVNPPTESTEWFGGAGISAAGTGLLIEGNFIAGLQNIRSTNDTPPEALTVFGALHTIQDNFIGLGTSFEAIGVCGQGIKFSTQTNVTEPQNNGHLVVNNVIHSARNGFENTKGAILWTDTSSPAFRDGGNTVRGNLVINGPEKYFEIGPMIATAIKLFEPAVITDVSGLVVTGGSNTNNIMGDASPCPNCIIDFYLDDEDSDEEALDYLGATLADNNGDFVFNMLEPIPAGFGIRTTSTSQANDVIPNTWAFTTTSMSNELYGSDVIFKNGFE